jgi:hypothetical protein
MTNLGIALIPRRLIAVINVPVRVRASEFMPFYRDRVYPHLVRILGNPKPVQEIRHTPRAIRYSTVRSSRRSPFSWNNRPF